VLRVAGLKAKEVPNNNNNNDDDENDKNAAPVVLAAGDVLDGPTTPRVVAQALVQIVLQEKKSLAAASLNTSLGVQGENLVKLQLSMGERSEATIQTAAAAAVAAATEAEVESAVWGELFLPLDGPELWRASVPLPKLTTAKGQSKGGGGPSIGASLAEASVDPEEAAAVAAAARALKWVREWGLSWGGGDAKKNFGLTTKVRVKDTAQGVGLYFDPSVGTGFEDKDSPPPSSDLPAARAPSSSSSSSSSRNARPPPPIARRSKVGSEGGIEVVVDASMLDPCSVRVRARRFAYTEGSPVKDMSEAAILRRLNDDFSRWVKAQGI
jgi:hypothetical protein